VGSISSARDACFHIDQKKVLSDIIDQEVCRDLNVGESKVVDMSRFSSPTTIAHKYILEKVKPNEYKVKLNLHFRENQILQDRPKKLGQKMQTKINQCLARQNPKLLGPNGEKLTIELVPLAEKHLPKYKEIKSFIFVDDDETVRQNSHLYTKQIDCAVILHELFHLMGLVDEYQELEKIKSFEQDCRSFGPDDSIMTSKIPPDWEEMEELTCNCDLGLACTPYSKEEIKRMTSCPAPYGTYTAKGYFRRELNENGERVKGEPANVFSNKIREVPEEALKPNEFRLPPRSLESGRSPNSILYPAHFRAIVYPGCKAKNSVYYDCARDAKYRPFKIVGSCNQKPAACKDPKEWLK
jgi:hypothetical protein